MPCEEFEFPNLVSIGAADVLANGFFAVPVDAKHKLFHFSGIICHNFIGQSGDWKRYAATVTLPSQGLNWVLASEVDPNQNRFAVEREAATVFLASISNRGTAVDAGWAVDRVTTGVDGNGHLNLQIHVAVRDSDGFIARLGYRMDVLARTSL
jgi:hypothetical protein